MQPAPKIGAPGALKAAAFFVGTAAHDADDRIVYDKATGALFYDSNGNIAGGVIQLATLSNKPTLVAGFRHHLREPPACRPIDNMPGALHGRTSHAGLIDASDRLPFGGFSVFVR